MMKKNPTRTVRDDPAIALQTEGLALRSDVALFVRGYKATLTVPHQENQPGHVMGLWTEDPDEKPDLIPPYEEDFVEAFRVAEQMRQHGYVVEIFPSETGWMASMVKNQYAHGLRSPAADKLPETICRLAVYLRWQERLATNA